MNHVGLRIALISTPWPLFNRPSIQLGALKAYLGREVPKAEVDTHHVYLQVAAALGYGLYAQISERSWLSEAPYAALLYPERLDTISRFWSRHARGVFQDREIRLEKVCQTLKSVTDTIVDEKDWAAYHVAGFSINFSQLTSTLFFIHEIKQRAPDLKIVVGGSACSGEMGLSLLNTFPEIDFAVSGEGEVPLAKLCRLLLSDRQNEEVGLISGLMSRAGYRGKASEAFSQVPDLDVLPVPDYSDYFQLLNSFSPKKRFFPKIPVEMSRGCWWRKHSSKKGRGCAFCNLNIQWNGYRAKSPEKMLSEIRLLSEKYETLSLSFMDNLLPNKDLTSFFKKLASPGKEFRLFAEVRASTSREELATMASAGMRYIQVGIEALSTPLLKKLNKGTTAIENLEIMKNCETPGFPGLVSNLILHFPGSEQSDVADTLANLEFAMPFQPLKPTPFWLGYGSPVWHNPKGFGIKRTGNHPFYSYLFPGAVLRKLKLMMQGYHGGIRDQKHLWQPVKEAVARWENQYRELHQSPRSEPILSYQDGGDFLIIRERRLGEDDLNHRLKGSSRKIYLFCQQNRPLRSIVEAFPAFGEDKILSFLSMMVDKRLMFRENERYLSLAVPSKGYARDP
ncbi:MAG: RiPP maturation radical SAM C-methyltransferase [Deltaproteobacteria bacterium]|nr:RiPP maturation radical SAM C-methyltransferase [Deltaproteobacteria bacterium]MBW1976987.1 RiPP maturation radical SAM C-methyltransferase [Deltaproteobacteria bacterium]MBW2043717.1 RiPP maturation radical SAM C-methyltransferase [Deltaproteobacteria bacterium]